MFYQKASYSLALKAQFSVWLLLQFWVLFARYECLLLAYLLSARAVCPLRARTCSVYPLILGNSRHPGWLQVLKTFSWMKQNLSQSQRSMSWAEGWGEPDAGPLLGLWTEKHWVSDDAKDTCLLLRKGQFWVILGELQLTEVAFDDSHTLKDPGPPHYSKYCEVYHQSRGFYS